MDIRKTALCAAAAVALGVSAEANAVAVSQLVIEDVGSTVGGVFNPATDGNSGGFGFVPVDPETYGGLVGFSTDTGTPMLWGGATQGTGVFTSGFTFAFNTVLPFTYGTIPAGANSGSDAPFFANGAQGDISGNTLTISDLGWAINFAAQLDFPQDPDAGTLQVNWVEPGANPNEFLVSFQWSHLITAGEDPTGGQFENQNAGWILEGTMTVVPVPAAVWLLGSGLVGLAAVARRKRSNSDVMPA